MREKLTKLIDRRKKRTFEKTSIRIEAETYQRFKARCRQLRYSMGDVLVLLIEDFLAIYPRYEDQVEASVTARQGLHPDLEARVAKLERELLNEREEDPGAA